MLVSSILFSFFSSSGPSVGSEMLLGAKDAVFNVLSLAGAMCFWNGMISIARESGLLKIVAHILKPLTHILFPSVEQGSKAEEAIVSNMSANMLGMGNAATPFGINAMHELDLINHASPYASDAMCMFVVINTASIQLLPTTMLAILSGGGAKEPFCIIIPTLVSSFISFFAAVVWCRILSHTKRQVYRK